jgi:hypothetical protein
VEHLANLVVGRWRRPIGRENESRGRGGFANRDGLRGRLRNGGCRCLLHFDAQAQPNLRQRDVGQRVARALGDVRIDEGQLGAQLVVVEESWEPFGFAVRIASHGIPLPGASNGMDGRRRNGRDISEVPRHLTLSDPFASFRDFASNAQ